MSQVHTAVVILNWNGRAFLEQFLPDLLGSLAQNDRVFVADNGSTDDSIAYLKKFENQIGLIELDRNYGFTGGYNRALKQISAKYFLLLNSDVQITPNWLEPLKVFMDGQPAAAACQPKIRSYSDRHLFEHAGASGGFMDYLGYPFCRGRIFNTLEEDQGQYDDEKEIFWATGACLMIRPELFWKAGAFDEDFFAHMEEIDLCWRLRRMGYTIAVVPESKVFHVGGGTLPRNNPRKTYFNFRNNLYALHKNTPGNILLPLFLLRLILDGLAGLKFLAEGDYKDTLAVIKAHFSFYANFFSRQKIRKETKKQIGFRTLAGVYRRSIVWDHFILRRKKFSELNVKRFQS